MLMVLHPLRIKLYDTAEGEGGLSPGDISGDHTAGQHGQPQTRDSRWALGQPWLRSVGRAVCGEIVAHT